MCGLSLEEIRRVLYNGMGVYAAEQTKYDGRTSRVHATTVPPRPRVALWGLPHCVLGDEMGRLRDDGVVCGRRGGHWCTSILSRVYEYNVPHRLLMRGAPKDDAAEHGLETYKITESAAVSMLVTRRPTPKCVRN